MSYPFADKDCRGVHNVFFGPSMGNQLISELRVIELLLGPRRSDKILERRNNCFVLGQHCRKLGLEFVGERQYRSCVARESALCQLEEQAQRRQSKYVLLEEMRVHQSSDILGRFARLTPSFSGTGQLLMKFAMFCP